MAFFFTRLLFVISLFSYLQANSQVKNSSCQNAAKLTATIRKYHIEPHLWDDTFAKKIMKEFFNTLDPLRLYFTQKDITDFSLNNLALIKDENKLDACLFVSAAMKILEAKLNEAFLLIETKLQKPLIYSSVESFTLLSLNNQEFTIDKFQLEKRWNQWLKFQTLNRMYKECEITNTEDRSAAKILSFEILARKKIALKEANEIRRIKESSSGLQELVSTALLKSIAASFDPHTNYFTSVEMKLFESSLSKTSYSFGFELQESPWGEIIINGVTPGSPAWNSNKIHKGDVLVKVKWGDEPAVVITDFDLSEMNQLFYSQLGDKAELTLKKIDGSILSVMLAKEKIESTENNLTGFVLTGEKNIGYISLPGFYTDWGNNTPQGCANDLARAIIKLKKENIEGLILDLRFNGGGSMEEAIDLTGIFIDAGPVVLTKSLDQTIVTHKDLNRGLIFDGAMIILVNRMSASASEVVAGALQDYNRALIIGGETYGKATAQIIVPLAVSSTSFDNDNFLKVTAERLYRITGKTNQRRGVRPDIIMPDILDIYSDKEAENFNSLLPDSTLKKTYYTPRPSIKIDVLRQRSEKRIGESKLFNELLASGNLIAQPIPLNINSFSAYMNHLLQMNEKTESNSKSAPQSFRVSSNKYDNSLLQVDAYRKEINNQSLSEIEHSIYIEEAYKIMLDYIALLKK